MRPRILAVRGMSVGQQTIPIYPAIMKFPERAPRARGYSPGLMSLYDGETFGRRLVVPAWSGGSNEYQKTRQAPCDGYDHWLPRGDCRLRHRDAKSSRQRHGNYCARIVKSFLFGAGFVPTGDLPGLFRQLR